MEPTAQKGGSFQSCKINIKLIAIYKVSLENKVLNQFFVQLSVTDSKNYSCGLIITFKEAPPSATN
jgi:hypothetical protein